MKRFLSVFTIGWLLLALGIYSYAQQPGVNSNLASVFTIPLDSTKRTYSQAMANLVVASSPTTYWQLCGSATSTVRVTRMTIAGRQTTAAHADFQLIKTSTAATGGTSSQRNCTGSLTPHSAQSSNRLDRSLSSISGGSNGGIPALAAASHSR